MKKSKTLTLITVLTLCLTIFSSLFAGCTLKKKTPLDEQMAEVIKEIDFNADTTYKGKLRIAIADQDAAENCLLAFKEDFESIYPNIEVTYDKFPDLISRMQTLHSTAVTTNNFASMYDIIWLANEDMPKLCSQELMMPLDYLDKEDKNWSTDGLMESMVQDSMFDGHLYMIPRDYNQIVMLYNTYIFNQAKQEDETIKSPDEFKNSDGSLRPMTRDEFTEMATKLRNWMDTTTQVSHQTNIKYSAGKPIDARIATWGSMSSAIAKTYGVSIVDKNLDCDLNSEGAKDMFKYLATMVKKSIFTTNSDTQGFDYFAFEKAAVCFESRAALSDIMRNIKDGRPGIREDLAAAPMPNLGYEGKYAVPAGCSGYGMYRHSVNKTAAWLFLKNIVSESAQEKFSATGNGIPVVNSLLDDKDATWRNIKTENPALFKDLPDNFYHEAFVAYRESACTMEYKANLPTDIVDLVYEGVNNVFAAMINPAFVDLEDEAKTIATIERNANGHAKSILALLKKAK